MKDRYKTYGVRGIVITRGNMDVSNANHGVPEDRFQRKPLRVEIFLRFERK